MALDSFDFGVIDAADIAELPSRIENEDMRRREDAVGQSRLLRLAVIEIGERKLFLLRSELHLLERVAQVGVAQLIEADSVRVVWRDGHYDHALVLIIRGELDNAVLIGLSRGAMITCKNDNQNLRAGKVLK